MRVLAVAGIALILASCTGETTVIREVQVTAPSTTEVIVEQSAEPERYSHAEAIAFAQQSAPSLTQFDDETMVSFMQASCDAIDSWAPDYDDYLLNLRSQMSDESISDRDEVLALVVASIYSVCVEHQISILDLLEEESNDY